MRGIRVPELQFCRTRKGTWPAWYHSSWGRYVCAEGPGLGEGKAVSVLLRYKFSLQQTHDKEQRGKDWRPGSWGFRNHRAGQWPQQPLRAGLSREQDSVPNFLSTLVNLTRVCVTCPWMLSGLLSSVTPEGEGEIPGKRNKCSYSIRRRREPFGFKT